MRKVAAMAFVSVVAVCGQLHAQDAARSVWDGVYTAAQAERGKTAYLANCVRCHGSALAGADEIPPLAGSHFMVDWDGQSVADLVHRIHATMPLDNPGSVGVATSTDILAFLLASNQIPAGAAELPSDVPLQSQIRIEAVKPAK